MTNLCSKVSEFLRLPNLVIEGYVWYGIYIFVSLKCSVTNQLILASLPTSHSSNDRQFLVFPEENYTKILPDHTEALWLSEVLHSIRYPDYRKVNIEREIFILREKVIILNCIDFMYGHCLLKLLNSQRHLEDHPEYGLILIIPKFLRWMVPDGVGEVWTVDIPLNQGRTYFPSLDKAINEEIKRFSKVTVSEAYSHPSRFDISCFTRIKKHDFHSSEFRITFVWREDRLWKASLLSKALKRKLGLFRVALFIQRLTLIKFFQEIKKQLPNADFTVVGLGTSYTFPDWIEDYRVDKFSDNTESFLCKIYSESRLVIGVHGSNMLLPSGHAGMTIDLLPTDRLGNFAQDILYQEQDARIASFRYRFIAEKTPLSQIVDTAVSMIKKYPSFVASMTQDN